MAELRCEIPALKERTRRRDGEPLPIILAHVRRCGGEDPRLPLYPLAPVASAFPVSGMAIPS